MNANLRKSNQKRKRQLAKRQQQLQERIDRSKGFGNSDIVGKKVKYKLSEKQQAISGGGIGLAQGLIKQTELREHINQAIPIFKYHAPYTEADHVFNIAFNLLTGGTCLEHLEHRRTDEAYLDALGTQRTGDSAHPRPNDRRRFLSSFQYRKHSEADAGHQQVSSDHLATAT